MNFTQRIYLILKRLIDIIFVIIILFFCWPIFILIALIIKFDTRGPVFYSQERMGKGFKKNIIYKFRTMEVNARELSEEGKIPVEQYITGVGKLLRNSRIDELSQLINILKGEMSFIGPRPNNVYKTELKLIKENPKRKDKFKVKPGILSLERLLSVWPEIKETMLKKMPNTKVLLSLDQKVVANKLDFELYYVNNIGPYLDLMLLYYGLRLFVREIFNLFRNNKPTN